MATHKNPKWDFQEEWYCGSDYYELEQIQFTTKNKDFFSKRGIALGCIRIEKGDITKVEGLKIGFGNWNSGAYVWKDGKKQYVHHIVMQSIRSSLDLTKQRVGFVDGDCLNVRSLNLFVYDIAGKPVVNKWKARNEALENLYCKGLVKKVTK